MRFAIMVCLVVASAGVEPAVASSPSWSDITANVTSGRLGEAIAQVEEILADARDRGEARDWTRALIERRGLQSALGASETAAQRLRETPWPDDPASRAILELHWADALATYYRAYSYEIRKREGTAGADSLDLKSWGLERIGREIDLALHRAWHGSTSWGDQPLEAWFPYLVPNDYPERIRGTLRDAVTYSWVEYLANSSLWSPAMSTATASLDLESLLTGPWISSADPAAFLTDADTHPLRKIGLLTADLRAWHLAHGRDGAALEAELEHLRRVHHSRRDLADRMRVRQYLETRLLDVAADEPWWALGQWQLARFLQQETEPDHFIRARFAAMRGAARHPGSEGGRLCAEVVQQIEAPRFHLQAMAADAPGRRTIAIAHRNVQRLHFRGWRWDLASRWAGDKPWPDRDEIRNLIVDNTADLAWTVDLPTTSDYAEHRTWTGLPECAPGAYIVVASTSPAFAAETDELHAATVLVSDIVVTAQSLSGAVNLVVRDGRTGRPVPGAEVRLRSDAREQGPLHMDRLLTDVDGRAVHTVQDRLTLRALVTRGEHLALLESIHTQHQRSEAPPVHCFLYTDRAVYRPGQTVHWKLVAYESDALRTVFATAPDHEVTVELRDSRGQVHETLSVTTNDFGSASGTFDLPGSGLLGTWTIQTDPHGRSTLRVEEYQRPTFEVALHDPAQPLRLGWPATVTGQASYYFGEPVGEGRAVWRVSRQTSDWRGWSSLAYRDHAIVATDTTAIGPQGRFTISFDTGSVPVAQDSGPQLVTYFVAVDVTDAGGETRSAARSFQLATVSILGTIEGGDGFLVAGVADTLRVQRTDANRVGRAGRGRWTLNTLQQPERALLAGDVPRTDFTQLEALFATTGDSLQPRWQTDARGWDPGADWPTGEVVASGRLNHDANGEAILPLTVPAPGLYRLIYQTEDDDGRTSHATRNLLVAGDGPADIRVPLILVAAADELPVGATARFFVHCGLDDAAVLVQVFVGGELQMTEFLPAGSTMIEVPVTVAGQRGLHVDASLVQDHQLARLFRFVRVPRHEKRLQVALSTFRDHLQPGETERFAVTVTGSDALPAAGELLAWMVDRSLDAIARPHLVDPISLYSGIQIANWSGASIGQSHTVPIQTQPVARSHQPVFRRDRLHLFPGSRLDYTLDYRGRLHFAYLDTAIARQLAAEGIGLLPAFNVEGARYMVEVKSARATGMEKLQRYAIDSVDFAMAAAAPGGTGDARLEEVVAREDFAETAFFLPHVDLDSEGSATIEFRVPEAVTEWKLQIAALTRDLKAGHTEHRVRTVKDLLVRPYLPRFLREGDEAELRVVIGNRHEDALAGHVQLRLEDPHSGADLSADFALHETQQSFVVPAGATTTATFPVRAPAGLGEIAVRAVAIADDHSDGERRAIPILPGRAHLVQSRFAALQDSTHRKLYFAPTADPDPTRREEQLVITVDTQLLSGVLRALPYLMDQPYESTDQTLNRYLSTAILTAVHDDEPLVSALSVRLANRGTPLESWDERDPNRRLRLEETPWVQQARGAPTERPLHELLDPEVVRRQRQESLARLKQHQDASGGFPWFAGGEPSLSMTLNVLLGLARGTEFGLEIPTDLAQGAWRFVTRQIEPPGCAGPDCDPQVTTLTNYVLSCYGEESDWNTGYSTTDRAAMLDLSWRHRLALPRLLQACLALTLERAGRHEDARVVVDALLDTAHDDPDLGVFWMPEDRAWLWFNDTVAGHAFILRAVSELAPEDPHLAGLAQWLLLNKQLEHWKSTRATAEAVYALVHYQRAADILDARQEVRVQVGAHDRHFGSHVATTEAVRDRLVLNTSEIDPAAMSTITVSQSTPGLSFASATWHFSTEQPTSDADGDLFAVTRQIFRRHHDGQQWILTPLADGETIALGEQIEVHLSLTARHAAEYVHLRDPRPAGCEPTAVSSGHRRELGLRYYQEIRDSGANFFFAWLPAGQYTLKHRLRAATTGIFRAQPTVLQSMYAPEFTAHSAGEVVRIR